uniref:GIY-YIG domain-containing protein n=1 Tax=viral metagenome TaxID=1070528 RepID=A0A6C0HG51_9ZZZZ
MGCIYRILNKTNGKSYIGQTVYDSPQKRWNVHKNIYKQEKHQEYLYRAMRKHGFENFEFSIICICKKDELSELECKYIKDYNSLGKNGYNMTSGGEGRRDCKLSEETKRKISLAGKGRVPSEETRKKLSMAGVGRKLTEEAKLKMKETVSRKPKPEKFIKVKLPPSVRIIKDSTREKLRNNMLGKPKSAEHIANVKKAKRKLSEEDVLYIRDNPEKLQGKDLALKFNLSRTSISRIINKKRYI